MSPSETEAIEVHTPQVTDALVDRASEKEEQKNDLCYSDDSGLFMDDSDNIIVDIL